MRDDAAPRSSVSLGCSRSAPPICSPRWRSGSRSDWTARQIVVSAGFGVLNAFVSRGARDVPAAAGRAVHRHRRRSHAARVVGSQSSADAATEPRGAGHVRAHDRDGESRRSGVQRDRRERAARARRHVLPRHRQARASRSTSSRIRRTGAIRTTCSSPARARRSSAITCRKGSISPRSIICRAAIARVHPRASRHGHDHAISSRRRASGDGAPCRTSRITSIPGRVPQSAETAVCMLADGIEAAARVLQRSDAAADPRRHRSHRAAAHGAGPAARGAAHAAQTRDHQGRVHARARRACITTASTIRRRAAA